MINSKKYYKKNELHLLSYEKKANNLSLVIINRFCKDIDSITFSFCEEEYCVLVNTNSRVIKIEQSVDGFRFQEPFLKSFSSCGEEILLDYGNDNEYMVSSKSINYLSREKYEYIKLINKKYNIPKNNITAYAEDYGTYWYCTCGQVNLHEQETCLNCGNEQEVLFKENIDYNHKKEETRKLMNINMSALIWQIVSIIFNFLFIGVFFKGDILYSNEFQLLPLNIFNRVIVFFVPLLTIGCLISRNYYKRKLELSLEISRLIVLIYLNIIGNVYFMMQSYNFIQVILLNIIFISYYIYYAIKNLRRIYGIVSSITIFSLLIGLVIQWSSLKKYDMKLRKEGIELICNINEEKYEVPEIINGNKVYAVIFEEDRDYSNIKEIHISKYIKRFNLYYTMVLPSLEKITVDEDNEYFEVKDGILFNKGTSDVVLCPAMKRDVYVDWEKVYPGDFFGALNLERVVFSKNVKRICSDAFAYCYSLESIEFEEDSQLETLESKSFQYCRSLTSVTIPDSLVYMERAPFYSCNNIKEITLPFIGEYRYARESITNQTHALYPFGYGFDWNYNEYVNLSLEKMVITKQTYIQGKAFYKCPCKYIEINDDLLSTSFGVECFYMCKNLEEIKIPSNITKISEKCFESDENLHSITLPSGMKTIEKDAFANCMNVTNVNFQGNVSNLTIEEEGNGVFIQKLQ